MTPNMRAKLVRNIQYHEQTRDYYADEVKKEKEEKPPAPAHPPRGATGAVASPPKPLQSAAEKLAEMHADVVKQLEAVLAADLALDPKPSSPLLPQRNPGFGLKPTAGVFH
jgi:hypothetical protein